MGAAAGPRINRTETATETASPETATPPAGMPNTQNSEYLRGRLLERDYLQKLVPDICYTNASYLVLTLRLLLLRLLRLLLQSC